MRIMLDTNILISAFVFKSIVMNNIIRLLGEQFSLVLCSFIIDELHNVVESKFPDKSDALEDFLRELPFEFIYSPKSLPEDLGFIIRDKDDEYVLYSAVLADVDILVTGDKDYYEVEIERPEILSPIDFINKYKLVENDDYLKM